MAEAGVEHEDRGALRVVRFDAGKVNVLTRDSIEALRQSLRDAEAKPDLEALVLFGRPGAFCAGLDLAMLAAGGRGAGELLLAMAELLREFYGSPLRVVAGCTGHAVAAGAMLLLVSDYRVAAEGEFRIGFTEVGRGLPLPELPVELARDRLSARFLQAATLTGRIFGPAAAVEAGFLDETASAAALHGLVLERANVLAAVDRDAYATTLQRVRGPSLARLDALIDVQRRSLT